MECLDRSDYGIGSYLVVVGLREKVGVIYLVVV